MSPRARGNGVRKVCRCGWRRWPKCPHAWYFSYKPRGGPRYRFSLDTEVGKHIGSKIDAEKLAADIRSAINAGVFEPLSDRLRREQRDAAAGAVAAPCVITLDHFASTFIERASKASGKATWKDDAYLLATLRNHRGLDGTRLGDRPLVSITEDDLEAFHGAQRAAGRAVSTLNHQVQVIKFAFRWAARKGYSLHSPVSDGSGLKRAKHAKRDRRIAPVEEAAVMAAAGALMRGAGVRLSGVIVAAIETGCRHGELLALQWADVDLERGLLHVRAIERGAKKTGRARTIPISGRLAAVLDMVKSDPAGRPFSADAYVFGVLGTRVHSVKKAWASCVLTAHGHEVQWAAGGKLAAASRAALQAIDLHFHDLRHEAGSRWLEAGMPLHHIKELLGHANISQTDTYLNAGRLALQDSMKRFDASRGKSVANVPPIEHRPDGDAIPKETPKDQLH